LTPFLDKRTVGGKTVGKLTVLLILIVALSSLLISQNVVAQYPPPAGSVSLLASSTIVVTNSEAVLTCQVRDTSGAPIADAPCVFSILSEPGTDAALGSKSTTKITNAQGIATAVLQVGSTPGVIIVGVSAGGLQSQVLVQVQPEGPLPPAAPLGVIAPPQTGDGGLLR
jgi:hypothetical protein